MLGCITNSVIVRKQCTWSADGSLQTAHVTWCGIVFILTCLDLKQAIMAYKIVMISVLEIYINHFLFFPVLFNRQHTVK